MKTEIEVLHVKMNNQEIGRLALSNTGKCLFEYDSEWLKKGFSLSPFYLPLKSGVFEAKHDPFNGLFGVFADSMPDGWGNLLLDRFLKSKGINLLSLSVLDRLALVGKNGLGALSYYPDNSLVYNEKLPDLNKIAGQVSEILSEKADIPTITSILKQTGSSGGARPKVLIKYNDAVWMVKFAASNDPDDIGKQEYFYSELANKCGIEMPETKLFEGKYFGSRLFDREGEQRFHVHSAAGVLHADHRYPSLDYRQLAQATIALTRSVKELSKLMTLMVFNVLIQNKDDHSKNFSYIYKNGSWQLSPAYDLLKSNGFGNEHSTSAAGSGNPVKKDLLSVADYVNFPSEKMKNIINNVLEICFDSPIGNSLRKRNW